MFQLLSCLLSAQGISIANCHSALVMTPAGLALMVTFFFFWDLRVGGWRQGVFGLSPVDWVGVLFYVVADEGCSVGLSDSAESLMAGLRHFDTTSVTVNEESSRNGIVNLFNFQL